MAKEKGFVSAVVYVHNCQSTIESYLKTLMVFFETNYEHSEIICVNDNSTDNSAELIKKVSREASSTAISIVNMSYYHGLEMAMNAGVDLSIGDYVFEFDSTYMDYSEDDIMRVYKKELEGYDIVSASSDRPSKFTSKVFYKLYSRYSVYSNNSLQTESFRVLSRRVINRIGNMNRTIPYRKAVYSYSGLKAANIQYTSNSSYNVKVTRQEKKMRFELAVDSLLLFTNVGFRLSLFMSLFMLAIMVAVTIYTLLAYILSNPVEGWTSTILFLTLAFFGIFAVMAIVIKYLQLILEMVFKRQQYSFESVEKLTE